MSKWEMARLGDICIIERGGSPRPIEKFITTASDGVNWIKIGDVSPDSMYITSTKEKIIQEGVCKSRKVKSGDFLLSNSISFGRPYILKIDGCIHDGWLLIRDENRKFDKRFLYYYLSADSTYHVFKGLAVGGVVNNLNSKMVRDISIPIPSMKIQIKIADVLDNAAALIEKRKAQIEKLDLLVKSRFVEMFGDPVTNPMGWNVRLLGELGNFKNGMNYSQNDDGYTIRSLGVGDFGNLYEIRDIETISEINLSMKPAVDYLLRNGDIVFVRSNGNRALVGRTVETFPEDAEVTFGGFCIRYCNESPCLVTTYLNHALHLPTMRNLLLKDGRGANIQNVNQQMLTALKIPLPPIERQNHFVDFVHQMNELKSTLKQSLAMLEHSYGSLMQKCFRGEIF